MDKEKLAIIKSKLPSDYSAELAKRSGLSKETVIKVMNGWKKNTVVIDAAIAWVMQLEDEAKQRNEKLDLICSQQES